MIRIFNLIIIKLLCLILLSGCSIKNNTKTTFKLTNTKQLTFDGDNGEAYFSSDDKNLIFQSKRDGNNCDKIYTMTVNGENIEPIPFTDGAFTCSYYSLDNSQIFFSSTMQDGVGCPIVYKDPNPRKYIWPLRNFDIYTMHNNGEIENLTNSEGYDAEATIHPIEEKIIFTSLRDGDIDLYEMDYDGKNLKKITSEFGYDGGAFYSPDGNQIVWRAWYPNTDQDIEKWNINIKNKYIEAVPLDLYIAKRDGSNKKRLTNNGATNWSPSWHPSGKYIVFSSNMDDWLEEHDSFGPNFELYMIELETGNLERLTFNETFDSFPVFSSDGSKIVYSSNRNRENKRQTNIFISDVKRK
tara:strand:- start:1153 stop:2214 length:1062 start_codon:yes stop_codon:yes gene_type:complete